VRGFGIGVFTLKGFGGFTFMLKGLGKYLYLKYTVIYYMSGWGTASKKI